MIDPRTSALLVVDLQNDTVGEQGAFADAGAAEFAARHRVVEKVRGLVDEARATRMPVIFVWHVDEPGHRDSTRNAELFREIVEANGLVRGTWGVAPVAGLEPQDGDAVVEKQRMSAFNATTLDTKLRGLERDQILVTGAWTNMSIEHTARTGADKGYFMYVPEDCCSTMNADWHNAAINYALQNVSTVTSCDAVLAAIG